MRLSIVPFVLVCFCIISLLFTQNAFAQESGCELDSSERPTVVLDRLPLAFNAGETIVFTGKLVCENG